MLRLKNELATHLSVVLAGMKCCEILTLLSKCYHQAKAGRVFTLTLWRGFQLAFTPVTASIAAAGVELQTVLADASRPNQHIYLMTRAELLVRLD